MTQPLDPRILEQLMKRRAMAKQQRGMPPGPVPDEQFDAMQFGNEDPDAGPVEQGDEEVQRGQEQMMFGGYAADGQMPMRPGMPMDGSQVESVDGMSPRPEGMGDIGFMGDEFGAEDPWEKQMAEMQEAQLGPQPTISVQNQNKMFKYGVMHQVMTMMQGPPA